MLIVRAETSGLHGPIHVDVKTLVFSGGELHVTAEINAFHSMVKRINIVAHLETAHDIMELLLATDALRRQCDVPIHLFMPYVPYARQDRVANAGESLSIKVFCDLINAQNYEQVFIKDPHSDVTPALLDRCNALDPVIGIHSMLAAGEKNPMLVCPDAGARKRVHRVAKAFRLPVLHADKMRDTMTGEITGTSIEMRVITEETRKQPLLVIDDICDGGRTFIELAKALREAGYEGKLFLYVTHGIFSKGVETLLARYDTIYTTRDWTDSKHPRVAII